MPKYVTYSPTDGELRFYNSPQEALKHSIKLNEKDSEHPTFGLFELKERSRYKSKYLGRLTRDWGHEDFYWDKEGLI